MVLDLALFQLLYNVTAQSVVVRFLFVFFAVYIVYIVGILFFVELLLFIREGRQRWYFLFLTCLATILSFGVITQLFHFFITRLRPFVVLGIQPFISPVLSHAFPSGHIAALVPIALTMWIMAPRYKWWVVSVTLLVGISRIGVGVHWPSDIFGGIVVGMASFFIVRMVLKKQYGRNIE
ncbi:MAG: phosphatase PAP2 family protein [bacterium]